MADKEENKPWMIRDVPEYVRRKIKLFAIQRGVTVSEALELIVNHVIPGSPKEVMQDPRADLPSYPNASPTPEDK